MHLCWPTWEALAQQSMWNGVNVTNRLSVATCGSWLLCRTSGSRAARPVCPVLPATSSTCHDTWWAFSKHSRSGWLIDIRKAINTHGPPVWGKAETPLLPCSLFYSSYRRQRHFLHLKHFIEIDFFLACTIPNSLTSTDSY